MLILTRKKGQAILIGDDITITVLDTEGSHIRLGITAPKNVAVDREEIREKKREAVNGNH